MRALSPAATRTLRTAIRGAKDPPPEKMASDIRRASTVVGLMLEHVSDGNSQPGATLAKAAQAPWAIVELTASRSFFQTIFQHWIALLWAAALLLLGTGALLSSQPASQAALIVAVVALVAHLAVDFGLRRLVSRVSRKQLFTFLMAAQGIALLGYLRIQSVWEWIALAAAAAAVPWELRMVRRWVGASRLWRVAAPVLAFTAAGAVYVLYSRAPGGRPNPVSVLFVIVPAALLLSRRWARWYRAFAFMVMPAAAAAASVWACLGCYSARIFGYDVVPSTWFGDWATWVSVVLMILASLTPWPVGASAKNARHKKGSAKKAPPAPVPEGTAWAKARRSGRRTWEHAMAPLMDPLLAALSSQAAAAKTRTKAPFRLGAAVAILQRVIRRAPAAPNRIRAARNGARAVTIVGLMVQEIGDRFAGWKNPGSTIALTGKLGGMIVTVADPGGIGRIFFRQLAQVAWTISIVCVVVSFWLWAPPLKIASFLAGGTLLLELAVFGLRWWMKGAAFARILWIAGLAVVTLVVDVIVLSPWVLLLRHGALIADTGVWFLALNLIAILTIPAIVAWPIRRNA